MEAVTEYIKRLLAWAEPGYRFVLETAAELAVLAFLGLRLVLRCALAAALFLPWLAAMAARRLWTRRKKGGGA